MTRKEFITELKTVVNYLWRSPYITGTVRVHLLSYFDESKVLPTLDEIATTQIVDCVAPNGHKYTKRYKTECMCYAYDLCYVVDLLIDQYFIMYELLENYALDAASVKRTMRTWISKISRWPINFTELGVTCKTFTSLILTNVADTETSVPKTLDWGVLNASMKRVSPNLYWFFHPMKRIYEEFLESGSESSFQNLYQAGEYIYRGKLESLDLLTQQKADYLAFEEKLRTRSDSGEFFDEFEAIAKLCLPERHEGFFRANLLPTHGSGAVCGWAHGTSRYAKYGMVFFKNRKLLKYLPELHEFVPNRKRQVDGDHPDYSEVVNVPKNLLTDRLISKEEAEVQFAQHAVQYAQTKLLENPDSIWKDHIDLKDADKNGRLAAIGSISGDYATVDLSSASDSVAMAHVHRLPQWYRRIICAVRCPRTSFAGTIVELRKFAPMGASTCFPLECQIFCIICICAIVKYHHLSFRELTEHDLKSVLAQSRFRVYGDDIVIELRYVPLLYEYLEQLGFQVNIRKSYTQAHVSNFRESCGYEYLNGASVSPLRTARQRGMWQNRLLSTDQVDQIVEYHNLAHLQHLRLLVRVWRWRLRHTRIFVRGNRNHRMYVPILSMIPYQHIDDFVGGRYLITYSVPTNYHLWRGGMKRTVDTAYQHPMYWGLSTRKEFDFFSHAEEISKLVNLGFSYTEPDSCRWLDYWISKLKQRQDSPAEFDSTKEGSWITPWEKLVGLDALEPIPDPLRSKLTLAITPVCM